MGDKLRNNKEFILNMMDIDSHIIVYASENLRKDEKIAVTAIKKNSYNFNFINEDLKKNKKFI